MTSKRKRHLRAQRDNYEAKRAARRTIKACVMLATPPPVGLRFPTIEEAYDAVRDFSRHLHVQQKPFAWDISKVRP